ncbi:HlyD family efflux transporter periplasmic adaptor subunit [Acidovorax sp. DW039]|uniref:HlyD family secretion protein n=1 Tax=Acidovorax sp. DW039 TaxID=3095606 RepID=UPI00308F0E92|nr:HlyD family efflux transporter periplasmic adaptor subunit [Acidovorax sp. DW039]
MTADMFHRLTLSSASLLTAALLLGCDAQSAQPPAGTAPAAAPKAAHGKEIAMARGKVEVQGGLLELAPAQEGIVQTLSVREGQDVQRGQLLLRLEDHTSVADIAVAESELSLAQARHQARQQRLPSLQRHAARLAEAVAEGATEPQRAEEAQQALKDAESELSISQAEIRVAQSRIAQIRAQQSKLELRAPEAGNVVRVTTHAGQRTTAQPAITLLPRRPLIVRAEVNESFAKQVQVGTTASVITDGDSTPVALPAAKVVRISPVLGNGRLHDDAQRGPVRVVECVLEFEQSPAVRVGQNVRVSFHE